jgi:hypothetical protein
MKYNFIVRSTNFFSLQKREAGEIFSIQYASILFLIKA